MRRLVLRFVVLGLVLGGGWVSYQLADTTKCDGPKAQQWAESSLVRLEDANADMDSFTEYTSDAQVATLASRAHARYVSQQAESSPSCLATFQQKTSEALYYEWKAYDAVASSDFNLAMAYMDKAESAREAMEREYYRLASQYGWDTSE